MTDAATRTAVATSIMRGVTSVAVRSTAKATVVNLAPADGDRARAILASFEFPFTERTARNGATELVIPASAFAA